MDQVAGFFQDTIIEGLDRRAEEKRRRAFGDGYRAAASITLKLLRDRIDALNERAKQGTGIKAVEGAQLAVLNELREEFIKGSERYFRGADVRWRPEEPVVKPGSVQVRPRAESDGPSAT